VNEVAEKNSSIPSAPLASWYIRFGEFEVDSLQPELRRNGLKVPLPPKPFKVLLRLLDQPGVLVSREELRQDFWPDFPDELVCSNVSVAISQIRIALGERASNQKYILTAPSGYYFSGKAERSGHRSESQPNCTSNIEESEPLNCAPNTAASASSESNAKSRWPSVSFLVVLFLCSMCLGMLLALSRKSSIRPLESTRKTIVIRPFDDLTVGSEQAIFCKGLGQELIAELSRQKPASLEVVNGRTDQYPAQHPELENSTTGKNPAFDLEGSVRREGRVLRIAVELEEQNSRRVLWAELYEKNDESPVLVQRDVAAQIAKAILKRP
jgi:TolB-like protein/DNA-binding winged helix-turn-helix (wHTH) protein